MSRWIKRKTKCHSLEIICCGTHPAILWFSPSVDVPAAMFPFWSIAIIPEKQIGFYILTNSEIIWNSRALSQVENRQNHQVLVIRPIAINFIITMVLQRKL